MLTSYEKTQVEKYNKLREVWGGGNLGDLPTLVTHLQHKVDEIRNTRYSSLDIERNLRDLTLTGDGLFGALAAARVSTAKCSHDIMKVRPVRLASLRRQLMPH